MVSRPTVSRRRPRRARRVALAITLAAIVCAGCSVPSGMPAAPDRTDVTSPGASGWADHCATTWQRDGEGWYESNPTYVDPVDDSADWTIAAAGAAGAARAVDVGMLDAGVTALANRSLTSVLVVRGDALVYERYLQGADRMTSSNIHSASKTLLGMAVAIAVRDGLIPGLDTKVSDLLPEYFADATADKRSITVRHLMTMSSGLAWTEDKTEDRVARSSDWVRAILDLPLVAPPGTTFTYSTGNTHVLSAILQRVSGMSTCEFVHRHLLGPMHVAAEHWGRDPRGISSGGYNVYLTAREMAKIGLVLLHDGAWRGQQLVPSSFVAEMRQPRSVVDSTYSYGELVWCRTISGHAVSFAWGWGGQFIYVIPDLDVVVVATENTTDGHNNRELDLGPFIRDTLLPALTAPST